ncbi:hypothetical protein G7079_12570 [Thermomonas sp. HDW16]|nr:hypothetical protein G7079_12570 [Thermomonas sp. HDW16]
MFRALPLSDAERDAWRNWFLDRFPRIRPKRRVAASGLPPRRAYEPHGRAIGYVDAATPHLPSHLPATLVAFYLPQFHPIPENDAAWGEGYTEWTAVRRATPQFDGHAQPRFPDNLLGQYDLRDVDVMRRQAALAREYGIGAFCFYFYWFHGRTLLEQPLRQWLGDDSIDLPFCLCWANESWSRTWDGRAGDILVRQQHDAEDDLAFIAHVAPYLRDRRALRVDGKPVLLVYRPGLLPDPKATATRWRQWCRDNGIGELHLAYVQSFERPDPRDIGFDAAVEFPPNLCMPTDITERQQPFDAAYAGNLLDWRDLPAQFLARTLPSYRLHPAVNAGWDNTPRRASRGRVYLHSAPRRYRDWLAGTIRTRFGENSTPTADRLVFINAWNEWAEGAVLEPDARIGYAWLQATADALCRTVEPMVSERATRPCAVIHAWYPEILGELLFALKSTGLNWRIVVTTAEEHLEAVRTCIDASELDAEIETHENRGRDILPFLHVANRLLDEGETLLLKLHTKRSIHRDDGDAWRAELIRALVDDGNAAHIAQAMHDDPRLGLIAPATHVLPLENYLGANERTIEHLARRIGLPDIRPAKMKFIAGSMFWVRSEALRPLLDAHLDEAEFETESGQVDGTFAHAIERLILASVEAGGFRWIAWPSEARNRSGSGYHYARAD